MCVRRKQCIELEQQFDFLKDLVATVPDMQGEGEENHTEGGGEKVPRRSVSHTHTGQHGGIDIRYPRVLAEEVAFYVGHPDEL